MELISKFKKNTEYLSINLGFSVFFFLLFHEAKVQATQIESVASSSSRLLRYWFKNSI